MYRFLVSTLLFCVILAGCGGGGSQPKSQLPTRSIILNEEFTLRIGQNARLEEEGLIVTLQAVADDSRCPEDAVCVWEGNARVEAELKTASDPGRIIELYTSPDIGSREGTHLGYTVQLVSVAPNTRSDRTIKAEEYRVGLLIEKRQSVSPP